MPGFALRTISTTADGAAAVYAADLDGDGDMDVLSGSFFDDKIAWYENDGRVNPSFTLRTISTALDFANLARAVDLDGDGDVDVLATSAPAETIAWFDNDGATVPSFTLRTISTTAGEVGSVDAADLDGDDDMDVFSASAVEGKIAWYENNGAVNPGFSLRTISNTASGGHYGADRIYAVDLDDDGDVDALSAIHPDSTIAWYENNGAADPTFTLHTISTTAAGAVSVHASDLDDDGDVDALSASLNSSKITAYYNQSPDTTPNPFVFPDRFGVPRNSVQTSNAVTITGINMPAPISVIGGLYSIGCTGSFTSVASTISNSQTVCVRHAASAGFGTYVNTTLTVGGVADTFTSITQAADTTPNAFSFTGVSNVPRNSVQTSNIVTITGIDAPAAIFVSGGTYSIGCGASPSNTGFISNGQTVCVRHTASAQPNTTVTTTLSIGGVAGTFTSVTALGNTALETTPAMIVSVSFPPSIVLNPSATLRDTDTGAPLALRTVSFTSGTSPLCSAVTNTSGVATCQATVIRNVLTVLNLGYTASFAGDSKYKPSSKNGTVIGAN